jgi:hypothetical protein
MAHTIESSDDGFLVLPLFYDDLDMWIVLCERDDGLVEIGAEVG